MATPSTCPDSSRLQQLLDDTVPALEREQLQEHLGTCDSCRLTLERLAGAPPSWYEMARDARDESAPSPKPSRALRQLLDELKLDSQESTVGGAEASEKEANANGETDFAFLQRSDRPGYLGRLGHYEI